MSLLTLHNSTVGTIANLCKQGWRWKIGLHTKVYKTVQLLCVAGIQSYEPPTDYSSIKMPEYSKRKLPFVEKSPAAYVPNYKPWKSMKRIIDMRGPEPAQDRFLLKQYGIVAGRGGQLKHNHFDLIRIIVNKYMDTSNTFAMWRVEAPWKPITKHGVGKKMGGGKGSIHHYVSPIRAGRVIVEVGGRVQYEEVYRFMNNLAMRMPFPAEFITHEELESRREKIKYIEENNTNPYSFEYIVRNNMQNWVYTHGRITDWKWWGRYQ